MNKKRKEKLPIKTNLFNKILLEQHIKGRTCAYERECENIYTIGSLGYNIRKEKVSVSTFDKLAFYLNTIMYC